MAKTATTFRDSHLQAIADALDNGYCRIYSGTVPTNANTALGAQVLLAELRFAATAETSVTAECAHVCRTHARCRCRS